MIDDTDYSMPEHTTPAEELSDDEWLALAAAAVEASKDWMSTHLHSRWERSIANFQSKHPPGSKYHSEAYKKGRSRLFRPKSRSVVRKNEATAAQAFFATADNVSIEAEKKSDPQQRVSAEFIQAIVNYRLDRSIRWFLIVVGAFQDAHIYGVCISKQTWDFKEQEEEYQKPVPDPLTGQQSLDSEGRPMFSTATRKKVVVDRPRIDLLRPENFRIDPEADWTDPIGTSPYLVQIIPMYAHQVQEKMKTGEWNHHSLEEIVRSIDEGNGDDTVDAMRRRDDSGQKEVKVKEYTLVYVHENFLRRDGEEWVFMTLGKSSLLTAPRRAKEVYPYAERPFTMGVCVLETHQIYPASVVELGWEIQAALNEIQNQRFDNVQLGMNGRYLARRSGGVDTTSLVRNIPGSVTLTNDPTTDVLPLQTRDVTASAYQEQNLLNNDFDEVSGSFSQSSVNTNRRLNETVGGMRMLSEDATSMQEYLLRTFSETWVEPTLRQLVKMEQLYESDAMVMEFARDEAKLVQRYGMSEGLDALLDGDVTVRCNVGTGATKPHQKLDRLIQGLTLITNTTGIRPNPQEVINEVMGLLGYEDGARFFPDQNQPPPVPPPDPKIELEREQLELERQRLTMDAKQGEVHARLKAMEIANRKDEKLLDARMRHQRHQAQIGASLLRGVTR
ncbi:MAG: hypothetical protein HQM00_10655 [Magnetococcales bacterium]|nr:hypothetical protein [Magnetococcales bacterium]